MCVKKICVWAPEAKGLTWAKKSGVRFWISSQRSPGLAQFLIRYDKLARVAAAQYSIHWF